MSAGGLTGLEQFSTAIDRFLHRVEDQAIERYRESVRAIFYELVSTTPQFTGRAVANWRIGVGAPRRGANASLGDKGLRRSPRQRGDAEWIEYALAVNQCLSRPYVPNIKSLKDVVFITNDVTGDTDGGRSSEHYLDSLQAQGYWMSKLRAANQPYITVSDVAVKFDGIGGLSVKVTARG